MSVPLATVTTATSEEAIRMPDTLQSDTLQSDTVREEPWAEVLSLGDARFGILAGGPFDGRCYPLPEGTVPRELLVPGLVAREQPSRVRYVLRDGLYRYAGVARQAVPAA